MVKILTVKSSYSDVPLAEIRSDSRTIEFIVDNTNGSLPSQVGNSLQALQSLVDGSSHLSMEEPQQATVGLHRYLLDNGDVAEVTTDGQTALLNGKLLSQQEKNALFSAIKSGQLNVQRRADIQEPLPIFAVPQKSPELPKPPAGFNQSIMDAIDREDKRRDAIKARATRAYDEEIEKADLRGCEDPEWTKKVMYELKYGKKE